MWRWADVEMRRCEDQKMRRWEDVKIRRCEDEKMWRSEGVKIRRCEVRRCEDEKMWRWEDVKWTGVKMRRCEDEKVWRWEDVKMWRWEDEIQTPTIGRTLCSDALGNKNWYGLLMYSLVMTNKNYPSFLEGQMVELSVSYQWLWVVLQ